MKHGRASYDGHVYREVHRSDGGRKGTNPPLRAQARRAPAALIEGARMRRENRPAEVALKPGAQVTGVIHVKAEGYGFVSPLLGDGGRENDLFVPPQFTRGALDGDVVRARAMRGRDGRLAGEVVEIVERRRQLALGIYQAKGKAQWVIPHDRNLSENIAVARHPRARDGDMVKVRLRREIQGALQGEIIAVLGNRVTRASRCSPARTPKDSRTSSTRRR
jgi:exoribonuclease R